MKIENIWPVMAFLIETGNLRPKIIGKKSNIEKIVALGTLTDELIALAKVNWTAAQAEILNLTDEGKKELSRRAADKYDILNDKMEKDVEEWIDLVIRQVDVFADGYKLAVK